MTYSTIIREAKFKIGETVDGPIITQWYRTVERDEGGNPTGVVLFEATCEEDTGEGRCELCWKTGVSPDGELILYYYCDDVNCVGASKKSTAKAKSKAKAKSAKSAR